MPAPRLPYDPAFPWAIPQTGQQPPDAQNNAAQNITKTQTLFASRNSRLKILYGGPERLAGSGYIATVYGGNLVVCILLCKGPIQEIGETQLDDQALVVTSDVGGVTTYSNGLIVRKHLGSLSQTIDTVLQAAFAFILFDEPMPGTAYVCVTVPPGITNGFPRLTFLCKGLLLHDPRIVPTLKASLITSAIPEVGPNADFDRSQSAYVVDWEGRHVLCQPNEIRFERARRVENLIFQSDIITPRVAVMEYANATNVDPTTLNVTATGTFNIRAYLAASAVSTPYAFRRGTCCIVSFEAKRISAPAGGVILDVSDTGTFAAAGGGAPVQLSNEWQRYAVLSDAVNTAYGYDFVDFAFQQTGTYGLRNLQCENIMGQSVIEPSEYVSRESDRLNWLQGSEKFVSPSWYLGELTTTYNQDGTTTVRETVNNAQHFFDQGCIYKPLGVCCFWVEVKPDGRPYGFELYWTAGWAAAAQFDLTLATVVGIGGADYISSKITRIDNGYLRCEMVFNASAVGDLQIYLNSGSSYVGDVTKGVILRRAQLNKGTVPTTYYPVGNRYPYHGSFVDGVQCFDYPNPNTMN